MFHTVSFIWLSLLLTLCIKKIQEAEVPPKFIDWSVFEILVVERALDPSLFEERWSAEFANGVAAPHEKREFLISVELQCANVATEESVMFLNNFLHATCDLWSDIDFSLFGFRYVGQKRVHFQVKIWGLLILILSRNYFLHNLMIDISYSYLFYSLRFLPKHISLLLQLFTPLL